MNKANSFDFLEMILLYKYIVTIVFIDFYVNLNLKQDKNCAFGAREIAELLKVCM